MPHVIVKMYPGRSEYQKTQLAEAIVKDVIAIAKVGDDAETYTNIDAYKAHLESVHFKKYKAATQAMVKSLNLLPMNPIILGGK